VVERKVWKARSDGSFHLTIKWRVTTDDSIDENDDSRNRTIDRDEWGELDLPMVQMLARAVAILKAWIPESDAEGLVNAAEESGIAKEQIVLWAIDLSDAYRKLAIQRAERYLQCLVWRDGMRTDMRAVFGTASMVQFFQRVSTFLRAVVEHRVSELECSMHWGPARMIWLERRGEARADFSMIYIDDFSGAVAHTAGEPLRRRTAIDGSVIDPHAKETPAELRVRVARDTCREAGWDSNPIKDQMGEGIDQLGFRIETAGQGKLACTLAKCHGLQAELEAMEGPRGVKTPAKEVESVAGRLIHLATVAVEGRAYLEPWYAMLRATRRSIVHNVRVRTKLGAIQLYGSGPTQKNLQRSIKWWKEAMRSDISLPLAPRLVFPDPQETGCAVTFQDAARGTGTGYGGFAPLVSTDGSKKCMIYVTGQWPADIQQMLMTNVLSMAAGELFAFICVAWAVYQRTGTVTHLVGFTDNDPTAAAINHACSGRAQMQGLLLWYYELCPQLQTLAIWLPGKKNTRSDALSRGKQKAEEVVTEAMAEGWQMNEMPVPPHAWSRFRAIAALPNSD
jgi:hypothetical protein